MLAKKLLWVISDVFSARQPFRFTPNSRPLLSRSK